MKSILILVSSLLPACAALAAERPPNILLVMADDLGYADLGCYGSEIPTPHIDRLAREGLRFSRFYNTAKCHSSRVSLLTGLHCDQAGSASLSRGATLAEVLGEAGYFTAMSGKWHLSRQPTDFGFHRYWGHLSGATNFFTGDDTFRHNGAPWTVPKVLNGRPFYATRAITDFALEFLDEAASRDQPFLLYVAYNAPHYPLQAPEEDVRRHRGRYDRGWDRLRRDRYERQLDSGLVPRHWSLPERPEHIPAWDSLSPGEQEWEARRMEVFAAMVEVLDRNVGRLVGALGARGLLNDTLVLFCSDNGACPFERTRGRQLDPWDPESHWTYDAGWAMLGNTPFRLYKQNQHEGGISSPLVVHWPKGLKAPSGSITHQPGHLVDLMATFIDLTGAAYPHRVGERSIEPLQGLSLSPVFRGEERKAHPQLYFRFGTDRALMRDPWKLVSAKLGRWELYHLGRDRTETRDLAGAHPDRVRRMAAEWFRVARDVDRLRPGALRPVGDALTPLDFRRKAGK